MITAIYFLTFALFFVIATLSYIYYQINKNHSILDFFVINLGAFISFTFKLLNKYATNDKTAAIFLKSHEFFAVLTSIIFMIFIYEIISGNKIKKRIRFPLLFHSFYLIIILIDFFILNESDLLFNLVTNAFSLIVSLEVIFMLMTKASEISSEMKTQIIKFLSFGFLIIFIETVSKRFMNVYDEVISDLMFNCFISFFLFNKISIELKLINKKKADKKENLFTELESKLKDQSITDREEEIVKLIICGKTNHQIAETLYISINTVKIHVYNIYRKFNVNKRIELMERLKD